MVGSGVRTRKRVVVAIWTLFSLAIASVCLDYLFWHSPSHEWAIALLVALTIVSGLTLATSVALLWFLWKAREVDTVLRVAGAALAAVCLVFSVVGPAVAVRLLLAAQEVMAIVETLGK